METLFIGQNAIFLPEVESTNSYATALLKNVNLVEGTVIYSTNQTKGRGQRGNSWISEPGLNLAASYILKPTFLNIDKLFFIYIVSALAVHDLMAELLKGSQFDIKIKWPNDILVNKEKIAGILNENIVNTASATASIVGIGINISQTNFGELQNVTSFSKLLGKPLETDVILKSLNKHLENYYLKLKNQHYNALIKTYYSCFYKMNEKQKFVTNNEIKEFIVKGINAQGLLNLCDENGKEHYFDIKEIKWS